MTTIVSDSSVSSRSRPSATVDGSGPSPAGMSFQAVTSSAWRGVSWAAERVRSFDRSVLIAVNSRAGCW